jgi:hypothetical protein
MGFSSANSADQEQATAVSRVKFLYEARRADLSQRYRAIGAGEIRRKIRQLAMLVSPGDARGRDHGAAPLSQLTIAARYAALRRPRHRFPSRTRAQGTDFTCCFHDC